MRRELAEEKLLNDIADCAAADRDERILEGERCSIAVLGGIVQIGNTACGEVPDDESSNSAASARYRPYK